MMTEDEIDSEPGGAWVSTIRVSNELVRSNAVPQLKGWAAKLRDDLSSDQLTGGTLALRQMDHIVTTVEGANLAACELEDFAEMVEYDPVRHVAMIIGKRDAPRSMPIVWLLLKVFPGADGIAVLPGLKMGDVRSVRKTPRGSFDEAFAIAEAMKGSGRERILGPAAATFEHAGTILVVPPQGDPVAVLQLLG
jgi:hypothetical protein